MPFDNNDYSDFINNYSPDRKAQDQNNQTKKTAKRRFKRRVYFVFAVIALILIAVLIAVSVSNCAKSNADPKAGDNSASVVSNTGEFIPSGAPSPFAKVTEKTVTLSSQIESKYAVMVDVSNNTVLARKSPDDVIYPASLTKIMALLVAAENVTDITSTFTMTSEIIDPLYRENASMAGFMPGEECVVKDMFYGSMLESGAEATVGLAVHISGSEEKFVDCTIGC